jgi:hypothetical protein
MLRIGDNRTYFPRPVRDEMSVENMVKTYFGDVLKGPIRHCERSEAIRKRLKITGLLRRSSSQ